MLTQQEVAAYLVERQLISTQAIVEGRLTVLDASRRNCNFKVISEQGPNYLLKQGLDSGGIATVAHEAAVYQFLHSEVREHCLSPYLPRYYEYDPGQRILILELFRDAQDMREYQTRRVHFSVRLARTIGKALATLHRATEVGNIGAALSRGIVVGIPWIHSIPLPSLHNFQNMSSANLQLVKIIQQFSEFGDLLDDLSEGCETISLIHGDIKWDNWLIVAQSTTGTKRDVKLVDWEASTFGDPCWDVGSVFGDYLSFWLRSIPIMGDAPIDRFMELARFPLEKLQPAIRAFWQSYVRQMEFSSEMSETCLLRAVQYGGASLLQEAYEELQMATQLTSSSVCFLQLSLNILERPEAAARHLLGLPLREIWRS